MFSVKEHLINLKGKDYLQVMWRLVWFRDDKPNWNIDTKLISHDIEAGHAVFEAKIYDENGMQKSSGFGSESVKDFRDYLEKAETKAVGRALAMLGYGTQFAPELDEEDRIVDSPVPKVKTIKATGNNQEYANQHQLNFIADQVKKAGEGGINRYKEIMQKLNITDKKQIPSNKVDEIIMAVMG